MKVGIVSELTDGEGRVALTPDVCKSLIPKGFEFIVQAGAGASAGFSDAAYESAGAKVVSDAKGVYSAADALVRVTPPAEADAKQMRSGQTLIGFLFPASNLKAVEALAKAGVDTFAMDLVPRITRAQSMDALSSMSTIAGYKSALIAAGSLPKFLPMLMTAAGTLPAAKVLVLGAGVAGLQAIATCKRLGAIVEAFDVRAAVKEQVESLGAKFVSMPIEDAEDSGGYAKELSKDTHQKELELIGGRMAKNDIVITTALIPGKKAPVLITKEMVSKMPSGSVIVDLAAPNGGNCEATVSGKTVVVDGVTIIGPANILSEMAPDASKMYAKNIMEFLTNLAPEGAVKLNLEDPIISESLVTHGGEIKHEPTRQLLDKAGKA